MSHFLWREDHSTLSCPLLSSPGHPSSLLTNYACLHRNPHLFPSIFIKIVQVFSIHSKSPKNSIKMVWGDLGWCGLVTSGHKSCGQPQMEQGGAGRLPARPGRPGQQLQPQEHQGWPQGGQEAIFFKGHKAIKGHMGHFNMWHVFRTEIRQGIRISLLKLMETIISICCLSELM